MTCCWPYGRNTMSALWSNLLLELWAGSVNQSGQPHCPLLQICIYAVNIPKFTWSSTLTFQILLVLDQSGQSLFCHMCNWISGLRGTANIPKFVIEAILRDFRFYILHAWTKMAKFTLCANPLNIFSIPKSNWAREKSYNPFQTCTLPRYQDNGLSFDLGMMVRQLMIALGC